MRFDFPKDDRVRKSSDFRRAYAEGKRFNGTYLSVFLLRTDTGTQRLGVTASKNAIGKAHLRNRAKRLVRETFRLSKSELSQLKFSYDWVVNVRRVILRTKLEKPLADFQKIVANVKAVETRILEGESNVAFESQNQP